MRRGKCLLRLLTSLNRTDVYMLAFGKIIVTVHYLQVLLAGILAMFVQVMVYQLECKTNSEKIDVNN